MRLLNVHTLELESIPGLKPHYAIASHRWLDGGELSFQDIQAKRNLNSPGYRKIEKFAAFVRDHVRDVSYVWIDTCCIDKTNSQELSEAITAMYRWYEEAVVCLAFLFDVDNDIVRLHQSAWFTRGWTLQELLAPRLVIFLSSEWEVLGHKAHDNLGDSQLLLHWSGPRLNHDVSSITGVPEDVIAQPERRRRLSVDEKMRWISDRTTTRPEDMAYSLLGILEVSMPLLYEEGRNAAERRLKQAIADMGRNATSSHGLTGTDRPHSSSNLPFSRDPTFVHRKELQQLEQKLESGGARVALVGLGGVGKSQLAIEYCYRLRERRPNTWVLWIYAGSEARYEESLRKLASDVDIPGHKDMKVDIFNLVYHWLRDARNGSWLLVLDNADHADFLFEPPTTGVGTDDNGRRALGSTQTRLHFLPVCTHGSIIITSRYRTIAEKIVDDQYLIPVLAMDEADAMTLLSSKLGHEPDDGMAKRLVAALDHIPLAITQAATYIRRRQPRCSIEQYLEKLDKNSRSKVRLLGATFDDLRRDQEARGGIMFTLWVSFDHVQSIHSSAADLLSLMSFFDHQAIPESLLLARRRSGTASRADSDSSSDSDANMDAFEDNVAILRDYSFISIAPSGTEFKMHRLVQFAIQRWIESTGHYEHWAVQSVDSLDLAFPDSDYASFKICEGLYPHAKIMLDLPLARPDARLKRSSILAKAAKFATDKGALRDAESFSRRSVTERQELLGKKHPDTLKSMNKLLRTYWNQERFTDAEELGIQVLELRREVLGDEHPYTLMSMNNLASTYRRQKRYKDAEELEIRALDLRRKVFGEGHVDTTLGMIGLASTYWSQGRFTEAEELEVIVLKVRREALGEEHADTLASANNLASTYRRQERYAEAESLYLQVLDVYRRVLGEEHVDTLVSMNNLAFSYQGQKRYEEAAELHTRVLDLRRRVLGTEHPHTRVSMNNLATTYWDQERYVDVERLEVEMLHIRRRILAEGHPDTLRNMTDLALTYSKLDRHSEAEDLRAQAEDLGKNARERTHPRPSL